MSRLRLVATGLLRGSGLFVREGAGWRRLDHLSSTGLAVSGDGGLVARALWTADDPQTHGELIVTDEVGVRRYLRVDELQEPHGLVWDGDLVVAVSTLRNALIWIDAAGRIVREERFEGDGDAWHLNCPAWAGDRLVVTCFGQHPRHRDWAYPGAMDRGGVILDVETGDVLASGFTAPHDPLPLGDGWLICDSKTHRVLRLDADGDVVAEADLGGWTRGMAIEGDLVHVGLSVRRWDGGNGTASVATLRLPDLELVGRSELPCDEVFALRLVPERLVDGLEVGFSVNPAREHPLAPPGDALAAPSDPVERELAATLTSEEPTSVQEPGRYASVDFTLRLDPGAGRMLPVGPDAWIVGARWIHADGTAHDDGYRARVSAPIPAGGSASGTIRVRLPTEIGTHRLELRLLQERRRWHGTAAATVDVEVAEVEAAARQRPGR